jgi:GAF domain-containing protein
VAKEATQLDFIQIFNSLSEIPLLREDRSKALKRIAELGRQTLNSHACTLAFVNLDEKVLFIEACAGFDAEFEQRMTGKTIEMGTLSDRMFVDFDLVAKGELIEKYNLQDNGEGVASPKTAHRCDLKSVLGYPLKSEGELIGYFNHFSATSAPFSADDKRLLEIFARQAVITIEGFEHQQTLDQSVRILSDLSDSLLTNPPADFLIEVPKKACELLSVPICILWRLDESQGKMKIVSAAGAVDEEYRRRTELSVDDIKEHVTSRKVGYLADVTQPHAQYAHSSEAKARGWVSLLSAPMWVGDHLIGMLDIYTKKRRHFKEWEKELFSTFAIHASLSIQKAELMKEAVVQRTNKKQQERERLIADIRGAIDRVTSEGQDRTPIGGELKETLRLIAEKCALATKTTTCSVRLWNKSTDSLKIEALYDKSKSSQDTSTSQKLQIGEGIAGHVAATGQSYLCSDTSQDPLFAGTPLGFSILSVPLKSGDSVIGTISVGSAQKNAFSENEQQLLESVVESVSIAIERANLMDSLSRLAKATAQSKSLDELLHELVQITRDLMREPICLVWLLDKNRNRFALKDEEQNVHIENRFFSCSATGIDRFLKRTEPLYLKDVGNVDTLPCPGVVAELNCKSMLAMPLAVEGRVIGILEVYSPGKEKKFTNWHRRSFKTLAVLASIAIEDLSRRKTLEELNSIMRKMTKTQDVDDLMRLILDGTFRLLGTNRGWISRLDLKTGKLNFVAPEDRRLGQAHQLGLGVGITGTALKEERPIRVDNVLEGDWPKTYKMFWEDTRAELAVPILISKAAVRVGRQVQLGSRPIGVINIESPTLAAFSESDEDILVSLASHAAIIIDKLEFDRRRNQLAQVQTEIVGKRDWDSIIQIALSALTKVLEYEFVNISLVKPDLNCIRTEYVVGLSENEAEDFKRMADHSLDSDDIQADIVRSKEIEVPGLLDQRFDKDIFRQFNHARWLRVFIPMLIPSKNQIMGTVEAGNQRRFRNYLYESDIQLLKGFIDYVVLALEQRQRGLLDQIGHEFRAPIVGIRSNASYLQRRIKKLDDDLIQHKFDDILIDCEILKAQVRELEHLLGRPSPIAKAQKTVVFRDIVIKTIKQLRRVAAAQGFDPAKIEYHPADIPRIVIYVDRGKLNQVVYNLLINAIKYAEDNCKSFTVRTMVDETKDNFIIVFKDWGIGIKKGLEEKIFEEGFRTPEAHNKHVAGSGLGLTIARKIMREIGGDLKLANSFKPTEFHVVLPKKLKEVTHDTVR